MRPYIKGVLLGVVWVLLWEAFAFAWTHGAGTVTFTHVPIGGGGAVIGVSSVPSANALVVKTDQLGCYISVSNAQWRQLVKTTTMPGTVAAVDATGVPIGNGCGEAVADPANVNNLWIETNGSVFFSSNQGSSFSTTCYPAQTPSASQAQQQPIKGMGHTIAVDPNNSSVIYFSTPSAGLRRTIDQGANCTTIAAVGNASTVGGAGGGHLIAFDTSGGTAVVGGQTRTAIIYASTYGTGVYKSTDGGVTWNLQNSANMPTTHWYMAADNKGNLWFVDNSIGQAGVAFKYNGSTTWTSLSGTIATPTNGVAVDPNACASAGACHIAFLITGGNSTGTALTTDGGSTWNTAHSTQSFTTSDVPWIANWLTPFGLFTSGAAFDNSGHLYTGGEGVYFTTPPTAGTAITFTSQTVGIEEALVSALSTSPGTSGSLLIGLWDINCFIVTAPFNTLPGNSARGCNNTNQAGLQHTYVIDWSSSANVVALTDNQGGYNGGGYTNSSGTSANGGTSWSALSAPAGVTSGGLIAGCIASASSTNLLWAPTDGSGGNVAPLYTTNGGGAWTSISVTGATGGWPWRYYLQSKTCAADRVNANTFFLYNWNVGDGSGDAFIKCTASGATCVIKSRPAFNNQFIPVLKSVPGQADTFFFSFSQTPFVDTTPYGFYISTDGGATKTQISGFTSVPAFGFGKAFPGHTFAAIVAVGFFNHVWGIWQCIDWDGAKTWQKIGDYPMNLPVSILDIDGDKVVPNVFYYGTNSGVFCSSPSTAYCNGSTFLLKRDLNPANDNTPMWLNAVA